MYRQNNEKSFLYKLISIFIDIVKDIPETGNVHVHVHTHVLILFLGSVESSLCQFCEKFIELITDLLVIGRHNTHVNNMLSLSLSVSH